MNLFEIKKDIQNNKNVCLLVWDKDMKGYKMIKIEKIIPSA